MSSKNGRQTDTRPPKMVLICPSCGYESPLAGDWNVEQRRTESETATTIAYVCPNCSSDVTQRPGSVVE